MSRKSVQRFCDDGMRKNKSLKRSKRILEIATRFRPRHVAGGFDKERMQMTATDKDTLHLGGHASR